ncbi:MAG: hypothetical protein N2738_08175 [Thermodesulfovibrionales bacterium]|nr:hypothetical protein [Thermodesulfovibrionales bacterium]
MNIINTHSIADFDALASLVSATFLCLKSLRNTVSCQVLMWHLAYFLIRTSLL